MKLTIVTFALLFLYSCSPVQPQQAANQPQPTEVVTIAAGNSTTENEYTASLEGKVNVEIRPQVEGNLTNVYVDEGAYVKAGQPLFKINDLPYREQLNSAIATLHATEAAAANAQLEIDKVTPLVDSKVVSVIQLKAARTAYQVAVANIEQAKAAVAAAKINIGYTTISAPVSGYIGRLPKKQGSLVSRADVEALTTLSDVQEIYAYFSLSEGDFIRFKEQYPGNTINDKIKGLPAVSLLLADNSTYKEEGHVTMIDGQFDKHTGAITLRASFPNHEGLLRSGNTGKIVLAMPHSNAIMVPASATMEMQDKIFVYTVNDSNKVSKQPITVIGKSGNNYLVQDGVQPGDRIVFNGLDHLQDGAAIQPIAPKKNEQLSMKR
jgi:membrane fusion protein (multidrug efflux system)